MKNIKRKHLIEAEKYRDRIGDRLFHPEKVDEDKKHLIKDDLQRVKKILKFPFGEKVLDIGCSDGTITIEIAKKKTVRKIIGVDISPSAIKEANEKLNKLMPNLKEKISFKQAFIEDLDFPDNYFDTISACETLEHIAIGSLFKAMDNLVRMLKNNGNMIITVPNRYPATKYVKQRRDRWKWPTHYRTFSIYSLELFLKEYFKKIKFYPLYSGEIFKDSIYLICNCKDKI